MRIAIGGIIHETSTCVTTRTTVTDFEFDRGILRGENMISRFRGTNVCTGGFIDGADKYGFDAVPLLRASAFPGGLIRREDYESLKGELLQRLAAAEAEGGPVDGVLLDLHGGAWGGKDRFANVAMADAAARSGILTVSVDLRLSGEAPYPASLQDANYGIRWLKMKAPGWKGDPSTLGVLGSSSGGHVAQLLGMRPKDSRYNALPLEGHPEIDASMNYVATRSPISDPLARYNNAVAKGRQQMVDRHHVYFDPFSNIEEANPQMILDRKEPVELPPMLVMIIPFVVILTQFAVWYEKQPFEPGDAIVVELRLSPRVWNQSENLTLHAPEGVRVEARVRDESAHEVTWRISPQISEPFTVSWNIGGETIEKKIAVAKSRDRLVPVSPLRPGTGFVDRLLYPLERAFDADSPVRAIEVRHPARSTEIFGIDVPWWLTFLIVSMLCAFLSKPFTKVQF
ncbi:MAG: M81 family metallopeptidase [Planctomycetes bacterium]|nr:M81 family metallopeptidase [Planctomycetota bacterium]